MSPERSNALDKLVQKLGFHQPTAEQAAVMQHPLTVSVGDSQVAAPLLVVAGAGSGKTVTMSMRAVYLAAYMGIEDDQILGLTFTRKAAAELESNLSARLAQLRTSAGTDRGVFAFESSAQASTYDAFALDIVREFGSSLGISTDFVHLDSAAAWQLMLDVIESWESDISSDLLPKTLADRALNLRQQIANQAVTTAEVRRALIRLNARFETNLAERKRSAAIMTQGLQANQLRLQLLDVIDAFEEEKRALGRLDFADQTLLATQIVETLPEVRRILRQRHRVVFLDEFQDTSVAQMRFLSSLFADHPVTAVGDPNQAIYGWRGASAASLADFHNLFTAPEAPRATLNLSVAWRNPKDVLAVANAVSAPLRQPPDWDAEARTAVPSPVLQPREGAPVGTVQAAYLESTDAEDAAVVEFFSENFEAAADAGLPRPSAAILSRTRARMPQLLEACRQAGIPAEIAGEDGLLMHPAVADLRAALEIAHDIGKSTELLRLLGNLDLGTADLYALGQLARSLASKVAGDDQQSRPKPLLLEAVEELTRNGAPSEQQGMSPQSLARISRLGEQLARIRSVTDWAIVEQVEYARRVLGLDDQSLVLEEAADVTEVLDTFAQAAADYQASAVDGTVTGFLEWLNTAEEKERGLPLPKMRANPDAVQILTVHAAKGLEWDLVSVVSLGFGRFPSGGSASGKVTEDTDGEVHVSPPHVPPGDGGWWTSEADLPYPMRGDHSHLPNPYVWDPDLGAGEIKETLRENFGAYKYAEERRLAYVAFTRPRQKLLLTGAWVGTGVTPHYPSSFYSEATAALALDDNLSECPNREERERLRSGQGEAEFPVPPSSSRKQITLAAALVRDEINNLRAQASPSQQTFEGILDSVAAMHLRGEDRELDESDRELARSVRALLEHSVEVAHRDSLNVEERSRLQVVANPQALSSFTATGLARLEEGNSVFTDLRRPVPSEPRQSASLGTAFHAWVEARLRRASAFVSEEEPAGETHSLRGASLLTKEENSRLMRMQRQFLSMEWLQPLEVAGVEVPFDIDIGGVLVRGRVDAVFEEPGSGATILVDWKTGTRPKDAAGIRQLLVQLELYLRAWERRSSGSLEAALVFVGPNSWQRVTLQELRSAYSDLTGTELDITGLAAQWTELTRT